MDLGVEVLVKIRTMEARRYFNVKYCICGVKEGNLKNISLEVPREDNIAISYEILTGKKPEE